ncbi:MAG TPA: ABC transporter ATP-binding protein, partial [Candidatus Sumerlaeota bacterium]|nr:ABC transporter ATP-binding protein [Candidatus Sumerlaeota bacterium]
MDRILDWVVPGAGKRYRDFWALRQVSFSIPKGRSVGIIGANGAGKSTLLKLISGTAKPTSGEVRVQGKIAALLELGMGFHAEFTGRQNIRMNGKLLGLTDDELDERIPKIIAFSELGDFIDQPLRTYSSGMYVRLGFSVVASVDPDILIVDEALSVGDLHFQQKCIRRIREFHEQGTTLLFVSHDPGAVKLLCEEAILL